MLKADGPAVRILWSIDCNDACVTAAVRTGRKRQKSTVVPSSVEPTKALDFEFFFFCVTLTFIDFSHIHAGVVELQGSLKRGQELPEQDGVL